MFKYFGTDGIRGKYGEVITKELVKKIGAALSTILKNKDNKKVLIGTDTRISGIEIKKTLIEVLSNSGIKVIDAGVIPTPAIAYLTNYVNAEYGIVISASHNPYSDNGIKFFSKEGLKVTDEEIKEIEYYIDHESKLNSKFIKPEIIDLTSNYINYISNNIKINKNKDFKIVLDCAHGAIYKAAEQLFNELSLKPIIKFNKPNGININENCGSTSPINLSKEVIFHQADIGIAYDGDGDRLTVVTKEGKVLDGDDLIFIISKYLKSKNKLTNNEIAVTVMSNEGIIKQLLEDGIKVDVTKVGDRFIAESLIKNNTIFGGEQSGHLIYKPHLTTGDGLFISVLLISIILETNESLEDLLKGIKRYEQKLINLKINNTEKLLNNEEYIKNIKEIESKLKGKGRILIRASGTEPLLRVLIETETTELLKKLEKEVLNLIDKHK